MRIIPTQGVTFAAKISVSCSYRRSSRWKEKRLNFGEFTKQRCKHKNKARKNPLHSIPPTVPGFQNARIQSFPDLVSCSVRMTGRKIRLRNGATSGRVFKCRDECEFFFPSSIGRKAVSIARGSAKVRKSRRVSREIRPWVAKSACKRRSKRENAKSLDAYLPGKSKTHPVTGRVTITGSCRVKSPKPEESRPEIEKKTWIQVSQL